MNSEFRCNESRTGSNFEHSPMKIRLKYVDQYSRAVNIVVVINSVGYRGWFQWVIRVIHAKDQTNGWSVEVLERGMKQPAEVVIHLAL